MENLKYFLLNKITVLKWMPKYTRTDLIADFIAGLTLGVTMIPQAIAYASLAGVPPQYGLYTAFMGSIVYVFLGTIKEVSIGPTSLLSILIFSYTDGLSVDHVILLCFLSGFVVFIMGVLRLGFLVDFISAPVTSAFTSATSIIILSSQIKGLLGINVEGKGLVELYSKIFRSIGDTNIWDFSLGICAIIFLLVIKQLCKRKVKSKKWAKALWLLSNGRNGLAVMITSSIAFYLFQMDIKIPFKLTGDIPAGLPPLKFPNVSTIQNNQTVHFFDMVMNLGSGTIIIPIVAVLQNIAIAKAFSDGPVDATQEMMTLGIANMLGSFVQAIPASGAFTRSAVSNASGVRTPLAGLYAASIILMALGFLTPCFYYIPKATLSAVLIAAVIFMIDYEIFFKLWPNHKFDLFVNLITLALCLSCGVEIGLFFGVLISMGNLLIPWTRPEIFADEYSDKSGRQFLIVKPEIGLYFPAVNYVTEQIKNDNRKLHVILDFSNVRGIDYTAVQGIKTLVMALNRLGRIIVLYKMGDDVKQKLKFLEFDLTVFMCDNLEVIKDFDTKMNELYSLLSTEV